MSDLSILILEDRKMCSDEMKMAARHAGFAPTVVEDIETFDDTFRNGSWDAVSLDMDLGMNEGDGMDAIKLMAEDIPDAKVCIILHSGRKDSRIKQMKLAEQLGFRNVQNIGRMAWREQLPGIANDIRSTGPKT